MSIFNPIGILKSKLNLFNFGPKENIDPIITETLDAILEDRKNNQLLKRLSEEKDISFNFQILYNSLITSRASDGLTIFKEWFLNPPPSISVERLNEFLSTLFRYLPDSTNAHKKDESHYKFVWQTISELKEKITFEIYSETQQKLLVAVLDIVENMNMKNLTPHYLKFFCSHLLDNYIDTNTVNTLIDRFSKNKDDVYWKELFQNVFNKLLTFSDNKNLLYIFYLVKDKIHTQESLWNCAVNEIYKKSRTDTSLYLLPCNGTNILQLIGDLAFSDQIKESERLKYHIVNLVDFFVHSNVSQEWMDMFVHYIKFMIIKNEIDLTLILSDSILRMLCYKPKPIQEIIFTLLDKFDKKEIESKLYYDYTDFFYSIQSLMQTGYYPMYPKFDALATKIASKFSYQSQGLLLQLLIGNRAQYYEIFTSTVDKLTNPTEICQFIISLALAPPFFNSVGVIKSIINKKMQWFIDKLNGKDANVKIAILICLLELNKSNAFVPYRPILDCIGNLISSQAKSIKKVAYLVLVNIATPTIQQENVQDDIESYVLHDRIFSFMPHDNSATMLVRSNFGKNFYSIKTLNIPVEVKDKKIPLKRSDIVAEDDPLFEILPPLQEVPDKSKALKILYTTGVANCNNKPRLLKNPDFSDFDKACLPFRFNINVSNVNIDDDSIEKEPKPSPIFDIFLKDLGESYDMTSCGFSFVKNPIDAENPFILFISHDNMINDKFLKKANFLIMVSPVLEKGTRLYRLELHVSGSAYGNSYFIQANNLVVRLVPANMLTIMISSILFSYYISTYEKSPIFEKLLYRVKERIHALKNIINSQ
ncbi:hypothetical protein TVAG_119640 [Trichomonas vaginalis G3]|uniref:Uncharacterized protein n=1 Tax=Trichomonas vaginalis (strain ATCC PRA-98 / G3) TaxID=412133 RepID=A2D7B0_TRIV3|nr:hypothetical protein TVAGG3_0992470 [Trichomonas vaginalis G3]EAY23627.1 hypothetical protein TVAG_119640 [Trichomonas vaginalis G3]KAI5490119.1 hypothetical protein TVAGG3_0992470 [Trichomonas vaginalis G3]|eukprot:XP_001276875.1 hypothetical protein [Trichomonas vaginalis G3]